MKTIKFVALLILGFALGLSAADFSVEILNVPQEVPLGSPIWAGVRVQYLGKEPLTIAKGHEGFEIRLGAYREDGQRRKCQPPLIGDIIPFHQFEVLQPGWEQTVYEDVYKQCEDEPGVLLVQGIVKAQGPFLEGNYSHSVERKAWQGVIRSSEAKVRVVFPVGEDLQAYKAFDGHPLSPEYRSALLSKFPTSSYATWAVLGSSEGFRSWRKYEPYNILRNSFPIRVEERTKAEEQANILKYVIDNRPDFSLMADLKIKYCFWLLSLDKKSECVEYLKIWAKDKDSDLSTWAKKYLDAAERLSKEGKK